MRLADLQEMAPRPIAGDYLRSDVLLLSLDLYATVPRAGQKHGLAHPFALQDYAGLQGYRASYNIDSFSQCNLCRRDRRLDGLIYPDGVVLLGANSWCYSRGGSSPFNAVQ